MKDRFRKIKSTTEYNEGIINISGLSEGRTAPLLSVISNETERPVFIITSSQQRAKGLFEDLSFLAGEKEIILIPEDEKIFLNYEAKSRGFLEQRLKGVIKLAKGKPCVFIAGVGSALRKIMPKEEFSAKAVTLEADEEYSIELLRKTFAELGYEKTAAVDIKGQFSIRGDIIDIFPYDRENPVRVEFFDEQIDSIREFDINSQRSLDSLDEVAVFPARQLLYDEETGKKACGKIAGAYDRQMKKLSPEARDKLAQRKGRLLENIETGSNNQSLSNYISYFYDSTETLVDYMEDSGILIIEDYERVRERVVLSEKEIKEEFKTVLEKGDAVPEDFEFFVKLSDFTDMINRPKRLTYVMTPFTTGLKGVDSLSEVISVKTRALPSYSGKMEMFLEDMRAYKKRGYEVIIICSGEERKENLKNFLSRNDVYADRIVTGKLVSGSEYTDEKLVLVSDNDIFASSKVRKTGKYSKKSKPIKSFVDIKRGDYVVHDNHGIGKFLEIQQLEIEGIKRDYLKIQYAGEDMLYVPVDQMDSVQKYIGGDNTTVRVNKLSGSEWKKTKQKVRTAIEQMAREIMELSAQRRAIPGFAFSQDSIWQKEFEDAFPYVETDDQLKCADEIKKDMEKPVPMERLLCGDVGYGKTEVAARAVFKCISDGKQAAILVPTTILANQHYATFKERLEPFPFNVEMLSRFRTDKQQEKIIDDVRKGRIDVIIGTHRLLSKDVAFKDLGLLIIDEEQRFGVQHKEAIKMLRRNVDVLTLSATPIPRTLHMSLIGARDMSVIEDPPEDRYPVQTYVMEQDDDIIRNAVISEMDRGGQTFVVYNRVKDIRRVAEHIRQLVPEAEVSVGHGRMHEDTLENVIIDFIEHRSDVLVCTTIIETGVDIPNANTMIILDADRFGLSQLYQLRGRVGRSNRMAYAYLMYQKNKVLTEIAEKRLTAIKDFTELGAGFKLAMRDLELRGAGNILGTEQSGHMVSVGYELYCKLMEETMSVLKGERTPEELPETSFELDFNAYIPEKYIEDETQRIEIYHKIADVTSEADKMDIIDELIDRFGDIPKAVQNLIIVGQIKSSARTLGIEKITEKHGEVILTFLASNKLTPDMILNMVSTVGSRATVNAGRKPFIKYKISDNRRKAEEILQLVQSLENKSSTGESKAGK
ncbi:MAG: transcription-repair coupling factor [Bacillota bacterium]|nr:transcription-repair coupling factor [Bacillota bacterium]